MDDLIIFSDDAAIILPITGIREREPAVFKRAMAQAIRAFLRTYKGR